MKFLKEEEVIDFRLQETPMDSKESLELDFQMICGFDEDEAIKAASNVEEYDLIY